MARKGSGKKGMRGRPDSDWGEAKTEAVHVVVTPTARNVLERLAEQLGVSKTDVWERAMRFMAPFSQTRLGESVVSVATVAELVDRYWSELETYEGLSVDRLALIRDGVIPNALEVCQIALALGLTEADVKKLITDQGDQVPIVSSAEVEQLRSTLLQSVAEMHRIALAFGISADDIQRAVDTPTSEGRLKQFLLDLKSNKSITHKEITQLKHDTGVPIELLIEVKDCLSEG